MAGEFTEFFTELLYGTGCWIGITIMLALFIAITVKWKYSSVLFLPVTVFMGIEYLNRDLGWQALILFLSSVFMLFFLVKELKK